MWGLGGGRAAGSGRRPVGAGDLGLYRPGSVRDVDAGFEEYEGDETMSGNMGGKVSDMRLERAM